MSKHSIAESDMADATDGEVAHAALAPAPALNNKQLVHLRGLGHHLDAVVIVGKEGLSPSLYAALDVALLQHELVKLKISEAAPGERHELAHELAEGSRSALVQVLGRTVLLYRRRPDSDPRPHIPLS